MTPESAYMATQHIALSNGDELELVHTEIYPAVVTVMLRHLSRGHYNGVPIGDIHTDAERTTTRRNGQVYDGYRVDKLVQIVYGDDVHVVGRS